MRVRALRLTLVVGLLLGPGAGIACSSSSSSDDTVADKDKPLVIEEGCQPILGRTSVDEASRGGCLLPYPSDFYRTAEGKIALTNAAKPRRYADGQTADIHEIVAMDGFSLIPTIVATLPSSVAKDGLPGILEDPTKSAVATSATVLVEADTGAFVPHYVDKIDRGVDAEHEPIVLRPFAPLKEKTRYVVALRGVKLAKTDGSGEAQDAFAPPPEGFRRLRDGQRGDVAVDKVRDHYERDVFGALDRAGVARNTLQLAWDFTTGSAEEPRRDMLKVRELTLAWLAANAALAGPTVRVTEVKAGSDRIWKTIVGRVTAPMFMDQEGAAAKLVRGANGEVEQRGTTEFEFTANIPNAVRDRFEAGRALAYGHGFFGGRAELEGNGAKTVAEGVGAVEFGIDWWGMSKEDVGRVSTMLGDHPEHGADFTERVHQAMANWMVMTQAIKTSIAKLPEMQRPQSGEGVVVNPTDATKTNAGECVYDPSFVGYFGASQGHILGGTLAALDPNISRAVLNVGGGGFTHMMPRSANFGPFSIVLDVTFKDELMVQAFIAMFQRPMDRIDPVTYAPLVEKEPLAGNPPDRRVLMQIGLGDPQVPNIGSFLHARSLGVKQTMPSPQSVFGLEPFTPGEDKSAITLYDFHIDTSGYKNPSPLEQNEVHEGVRVNPQAIKQMLSFLRPNGTIIHPCDGSCDPQ